MNLMSVEEYLALVASPKRSKYRNEPVMIDGHRFPSKAEARRDGELQLMKLAGAIKDYRRQPRYELGVPENVYVADFEVEDLDGSFWTEDVKGTRTAKFNRDVKLWRRYGPHPLHVISGNKVEIIIPTSERRARKS